MSQAHMINMYQTITHYITFEEKIIKLLNKLQTMKRWHIDEEISKLKGILNTFDTDSQDYLDTMKLIKAYSSDTKIFEESEIVLSSEKEMKGSTDFESASLQSETPYKSIKQDNSSPKTTVNSVMKPIHVEDTQPNDNAAS